MSEKKRQKIIKEIEEYRNSKVITYVTSNRPNIQSDIESTDVLRFREHLESICAEHKSIDLFIFSYGGELETAWELVNLIREYNMDFSVLIPYHARSAATLIALGAKEVVMGKMAALGPIDPTVRINGGELSGMELSVADIDSYEDFLRDEYQIKKPEDKMKAFQMLGDAISPILLGKAYKNFIETKKDAEKLLRRYIKDTKKAKKIVNCFIKEIRTHNHSISRQEAKKAGLNVKYTNKKMEKLMWDLYKQYEITMKMDIPYINEPPKNKNTKEIPFTFIESSSLTSKKIGIIKFRKLEFEKGSYLVSSEGDQAVRTTDGDVIAVIPTGQLIAAHDFIYDKTEDIFWINE